MRFFTQFKAKPRDNQGLCNRESGFNLLRWIMVVGLGFGLSFLVTFAVLSTHSLDSNSQVMRISHRTEVKEPAFNISQDEIEGQLRHVIESQLTAFRQDDYGRAYDFAAAGIKSLMPLPAFERMVKSNYPLIAKSSSVQFGVILDNGDQAVVNTTVIGQSGSAIHYLYILQRERSGWKIIGVRETKPTGTTA